MRGGSIVSKTPIWLKEPSSDSWKVFDLSSICISMSFQSDVERWRREYENVWPLSDASGLSSTRDPDEDRFVFKRDLMRLRASWMEVDPSEQLSRMRRFSNRMFEDTDPLANEKL
jgi:hypothetical protein